jgi:hypothetical protein
MFQALKSVTTTMHSVWLLAASCCWYEWIVFCCKKKTLEHAEQVQRTANNIGEINHIRISWQASVRKKINNNKIVLYKT